MDEFYAVHIVTPYSEIRGVMGVEELNSFITAWQSWILSNQLPHVKVIQFYNKSKYHLPLEHVHWISTDPVTREHTDNWIAHSDKVKHEYFTRPLHDEIKRKGQFL